jgi:2-methylfumaryl-CoA hydratase
VIRSGGNFFEDFRLGQVLRHALPRTVTDGESALYIALTGERNVLYSAEPVAKALGYPVRPVNDLLAFHITFGRTVQDISINAIANLGYADVRFVQPVYAGDTLSTTSTVIGLRENANGKSGIVYVRSVACNQHGSEVLSWARWVMLPKRDETASAPPTVVPELPKTVQPENLSVPSFLNTQQFDLSLTGSDRLWNDYAAGEIIHHASGMTVDDSDHTLATRLYQNNARLHFDELSMKATPFGRRLMYGGHVISVCRALSHEGLENALCIAAINGGAHCNPTFGGDTLYARTEILEKWELPARKDFGALHLRLLGFKNMRAETVDVPADYSQGKPVYHPNVVLDLDYTVLIPRR